MTVNVDGVVLGVRRLARTMPRGGRIVATASLAGLTAMPDDPVYAATKHAVVGFVRSVAPTLEGRGISINAVCPGTTESEMISQWSQQQIEGLLSRIPLRKLAKPTNIASAVAYLASEEAEFITGLLMDVNGGMYFG